MSLAPHPEAHAIEARLARLEVRIRRWAFVCILGLGLVVLQSQRSADVVEATALVIRDSNGVEQAMLGLWRNGKLAPDGEPGLALFGKESEARAIFKVGASDNGSISLSGPNGPHSTLWLTVLEDGPSVTLRDTNGRERIALAVYPDGESELVFRNDDGAPCAEFGASLEDSPVFNLYEGCRRPRSASRLGRIAYSGSRYDCGTARSGVGLID